LHTGGGLFVQAVYPSLLQGTVNVVKKGTLEEKGSWEKKKRMQVKRKGFLLGSGMRHLMVVIGAKKIDFTRRRQKRDGSRGGENVEFSNLHPFAGSCLLDLIKGVRASRGNEKRREAHK